MKRLSLIKEFGGILSKEIGWTWPFFLIGCLFQRNALFQKTHWSQSSPLVDEAKYVKDLTIIPTIYLQLEKKIGREKATQVIDRILEVTGDALYQPALELAAASEQSGIARFMAFRSKMDLSQADRFNKKTYLNVDDRSCHYILTKCLPNELFTELGIPELTRTVCKGDEKFFRKAFPDLVFSRGDSWENTMAYGKDHCEYQLTVKPGV